MALLLLLNAYSTNPLCLATIKLYLTSMLMHKSRFHRMIADCYHVSFDRETM